MTTSTVFPHRARAFALAIALPLAVGPLSAAAGPTAAAATFIVNAIADPGSGACDPTECTLREAITAANTSPGKDLIRFNIPGSGVQTISPTAELPAITKPVVIDGYSQPGAKPNTAAKGTNATLHIELDGSSAPVDASGLVISGGNTTVRGIIINSFTTAIGGGGFGVFLTNTAGNTKNVIEGNFIGTDPTGTQNQGNGGGGITLSGQSTGNRVGGATSAARNLISEGSHGVSVTSNGNTIQGNLIGTDRTGAQDLGNSRGVSLIGSDNLVTSNVIAFNDQAGVPVVNGTGNRILRNAIFGNGGLGIDLDNDGPTTNDPEDPDTGSNNRQNFPVITAASSSDQGTTIKGTLDSTAHTTFIVQVFVNPATDPTEGKAFLGQKTLTTNDTGDATFTFGTKRRVSPGQAITATATDDGTGDTSEFSAAVTVKRKR